MKSTRKLTLETLLQTLDYGVLRSEELTQRETEDLMNKNIFLLFFFLFILGPSSKELRKIPFIKISLYAPLFFFFFVTRITCMHYISMSSSQPSISRQYLHGWAVSLQMMSESISDPDVRVYFRLAL